MSDKNPLYEASCQYHKKAPAGKIEICSTKPCSNQAELTLAYSPGVAGPCLEIKEDVQKVWEYTARANMVAVVSDGTAVLGLGNIGPEAGLPVMEGKAVLFREFAKINAVPLCLGQVHTPDGKTDAKKLIEAIRTLEPSFGGINLEDIAAPACFEVEQTLKRLMDIPVFHDDQHGTAIISLAAVENALELLGKKITEAKFVFSGAGAAAISCAEFYIYAGAKRENILMVDINGVIHDERTDLTPERSKFAHQTNARTLADAVIGADVFMGLSAPKVLTSAMVKTMAKDPIVFAMANPTPEIMPSEALEAGAAIVGSGRSDFPNQINNVLGFPGIFRGALDVRAKEINDQMKYAAAQALKNLVKRPIDHTTKAVLARAYESDSKAGMFDGNCPLSKTFLIPKPFDPRVVPQVAKFVAEAAMKSGVARLTIDDLEAYEQGLLQCQK